ncbi:MAG TPA: hypothetical protein VGJ84_00005, partial [Polyangiaceae bacterium]
PCRNPLCMTLRPHTVRGTVTRPTGRGFRQPKSVGDCRRFEATFRAGVCLRVGCYAPATLQGSPEPFQVDL